MYKALGIWKGYYRVKKSLVSYTKPWTEARNNKYMKYHSKLTYQLSFWNVSRKVDYHAGCKWFIHGPKVKPASNAFAYFSQLFLNSTLSGASHLYKQLPNGQYLSDLCKMCNLEANLWKMWTGDHRFLTYIFKWERLNTAGHSHPVSIGHWVATLYND